MQYAQRKMDILYTVERMGQVVVYDYTNLSFFIARKTLIILISVKLN